MKNILFIGSHLGYPMDKTPLGGGAMVGLQLLRHWARRTEDNNPDFGLCAIGSGPLAPAPIEYVELPEPEATGVSRDLVSLSELKYARFCRKFEKAATQWILNNQHRFKPEDTCVVVNDISEGPTLPAIAEAGYPIISLWHVDVVDYFNKLYLGQVVSAERVVRIYEGSRRLVGRLFPDVLRLVFEKQRQTVLYSSRLILPSRYMAQTISRCYGGLISEGQMARRTLVVPWGMWREDVAEPLAAAEASRLRDYYQLQPESTVLMTLSRISPEKGLHLLLDALKRFEQDGSIGRRDVCLFICGESSFMQGAAYLRLIRAKAAELKKIRVFFPGYLAALEKRAYFRLAQLFISPSIHESYGLTIVEAMRAGLPILSADHYGARDWLNPGFGRKVSYSPLSRGPQRLFEGLKELLSDRPALAQMGRQARREAAAMPFEKAAGRVLAEALGLVGEKLSVAEAMGESRI